MGIRGSRLLLVWSLFASSLIVVSPVRVLSLPVPNPPVPLPSSLPPATDPGPVTKPFVEPTPPGPVAPIDAGSVGASTADAVQLEPAKPLAGPVLDSLLVPTDVGLALAKDPVAVVLGGVPVKFSVGDGSVLRGASKAVPDVALDAAVLRLTPVGDKDGAAVGLQGAAFQLDPIGVLSSPMIVRVEIDYSSLSVGKSQDWRYRVGLVEVPSCALAEPANRACANVFTQAIVNDPVRQVLTAEIVVGGDKPAVVPVDPSIPVLTVNPFAAAPPVVEPVAPPVYQPAVPAQSFGPSRPVHAVQYSGGGGSTYGIGTDFSGQFGSFGATPVDSVASWQVSASSGSFDYSYKVPTAPTGWGTSPSVGLSYSSSAIDGLTSDASASAGALGFGWNLAAGGFIERSYRTCHFDGYTYQDLCFFTDSAGVFEHLTIVLGGRSSKLIATGVANEWRLELDPAWRVRRFYGAPGSPDADGEWFEVTTPDGTRYSFGSSPTTTNSVWEVPVWGNNPGEPCYSTTQAPVCIQAWRWNLDKIVDARSNMTEFDWVRETNMYAFAGASAYTTSYTRGGYLSTILYGRNDVAGQPNWHGRITINTMNACFGSSVDGCLWVGPVPTMYPSAPIDLQCSSATCTVYAPTFFTKKVIYFINTDSFNGSVWTTTDQTLLNFDWPDPDGAGPTPIRMWLRQIKHYGMPYSSSYLEDPWVRFESFQVLNNRADGIVSPYFRLTQINDQYGGRTDVLYGLPHPGLGVGGNCAVPYLDWFNNTQDCFPRRVVIDIADTVAVYTYWKYVVTQVTSRDLVGGSPDQSVSYQYVDTPAWHFDDSNPTVINPTWGEWRGYNHVRITPSGGVPIDHYYFRGMDQDTLQWAGTRSVSYQDSSLTTFTDDWWRRGLEYETYDASSNAGPQAVYNRYTVTMPNAPKSALVVHSSTETWTTGTPTVKARQDWLYDSYGNVTDFIDQGDLSLGTDNRCTSTSYAYNTTAWIVNAPIETRLSAPCLLTTVSATQIDYDGLAWGVAPTIGNATTTRVSLDATNVATTITGYDTAGRVTSIDGPLAGWSDLKLRSYDPTLGYMKTASDVASGTTTFVDDPNRFLPTQITDSNARTTTKQYDALGRLVKVWTPDDPTTGAAAVQFTYSVTQTAPTWVQTSVWQDSTRRLNSWVIYDGLLQPVQSQHTGPNGGRVMNMTVYDNRGLAVRSIPEITDATTPGGTLAVVPVAPVRETRATYNSLGHVSSNQAWSNGAMLWQTLILEFGIHTTVVPPVGGMTQTSRTGRGETDWTRAYTSSTVYAQTNYTYDAASRVKTMTDPNGLVTTTSYDLAGRRTQLIDPDQGTSNYTYDAVGNVVTATTPAGTTWFAYDGASRPTARRATSAAGALQADWVWDKTGEKGLLDYTETYDTSGTRVMKTDTVGYDNRNRPTGTTYTVDTRPQWTDAGLAGSYTMSYGYDKANHQTTVGNPAAGGLNAETVTTGYNATGQATTLIGDSQYVASTLFTAAGRLDTRTMSNTATVVTRNYTWEPSTGRLQLLWGKANTNATGDVNVQYVTPSYDAVGNLTGDNDFVNLQKQCFGYDQRNRLTTAQTAGSFNPCGAPDGTWPAPYFQTYSYDNSNRIINGPAGTNYQYTAVGHAHALSSIATPGGVDTYTYDTTGNRTSWNNADGGDYTYTWDPNGRMKTATSNDPNTAPDRRAVDTTVTATTGTAITATTPTGTRTGDVLVAVVTIAPATVGGAIPTATTPSGWTKINESPGTGVRVIAYQRALTTSVPANVTITRSAASKTILNLAAYTGVDLTTPVDVSLPGTNSSGTSHTAPSLAVTGANRKLITVTGYAQQTATTPDSATTERVDNSTLPSAPTTSLHVADQTWASTAATGTRIATSAVASTSATLSIALRPRANTTDYLYDIDRHQILRKDPTNTVTLTIGNLELQQSAVSTPWATRYISIESTNIGIRNPAVNEWMLDDERGSVQVTVDYATGTTHQNFYTPYGQTRFAYPSSPVTPRSYLNQTNEPATQLTNLTNRYYDPQTGVFLSVDPLLAQTGTPYLYGSGNPTTLADPNGLEAGSWFNSGDVAWAWGQLRGLKPKGLQNKYEADHNNWVMMGEGTGENGRLAHALSAVLADRTGHPRNGISPFVFAVASMTWIPQPIMGGGSMSSGVVGLKPAISTAIEDAATEAASAPRVVIGGMEDLGPGSIGVGEETLASRLPGDTGSRLGNWLNNRDVLRTAMGEGNPIRDASVDSQGNLLLEDTRRFITMERDFMRSFGWTYDPATTSWIPPG